jgi:hypothetical protein
MQESEACNQAKSFLKYQSHAWFPRPFESLGGKVSVEQSKDREEFDLFGGDFNYERHLTSDDHNLTYSTIY